MKMAVSNIAWKPEEDQRAYALLQDRGVEGMEIAPTRIWTDLETVTEDQAANFREDLRHFCLKPVAFQALLFGKPKLNLFDPGTRAYCLKYLKHQCDLAAAMGAHALVFGSPQNRRKGDLGEAEAMQAAADFFRELGTYAASRNVFICLEPNPESYNCDFIRTLAEGARLVTLTDSPGVKLHFDTGGITLNGEDPIQSVRQYIALAVHFHVSEPFLADFAHPKADHAGIAAALKDSGYQAWISIEMRPGPAGLASVAEAIDFVKKTYL